MALLLGRSVKSLEREMGDKRVHYGGSEEVVAEEELVYGGSPHEPGPL